MKFKEFIEKITETTKEAIIRLENYSTLSGKEKKDRLDDYVTERALYLLDEAKIGWFFKFIIEKFVIKNIPTITQKIFDLIKINIKGITV